MILSKDRFQGRAFSYLKGRPSYPIEIVTYLKANNLISKQSNVADIGAGTGIFSKMLAATGATINAIEPSVDMRDVAIQTLSEFMNVRIKNGTSDKTNLNDDSIDLITSAQAFHWFPTESTRIEWSRILKKSGSVFLIWNTRSLTDPFGAAYEQYVQRFSTGLENINHRGKGREDMINVFFKKNSFKKITFKYEWRIDYETLVHFAQSSSYMPKESENKIYENKELQDIYDRHAISGILCFYYDTDVYIGNWNSIS